MDSAWITSWLAFVHFDPYNSPFPGPCNNMRLLHANMDDLSSARWVPRQGLVMAVKSKAGDYRRVSETAWKLFCEKYKGSGPEIKMKFVQVPDLFYKNSSCNSQFLFIALSSLQTLSRIRNTQVMVYTIRPIGKLTKTHALKFQSQKSRE